MNQAKQEISTPYVDSLITAIVTPEGTRLEKVRRLLENVTYQRVYNRAMMLCSLGVIRIEREGRELVLYSVGGEHDE